MPEGDPNAPSPLLVTTDWLADRLDDPDFVLIDAGEAVAYRRVHIPGAIGVPHPYLKGQSNRALVMPPGEFEPIARSWGLSNDQEVIVYATSKGELVLLNSADGSLIWSQGLPKRVKGPLLLLSGQVAFVDGANKLRLFTLVGGKEVWSVELAARAQFGPRLSDGRLQLLLENGSVLDYDMGGKVALERQIMAGQVNDLLSWGGKLFCAYREGQLVAYELEE